MNPYVCQLTVKASPGNRERSICCGMRKWLAFIERLNLGVPLILKPGSPKQMKTVLLSLHMRAHLQVGLLLAHGTVEAGSALV